MGLASRSRRTLPDDRLAEVISWAETEAGAFAEFPHAEKDAKTSYLWMLCLAILTLKDKLSAQHPQVPAGHCSLYVAQGTRCALAGHCLVPLETCEGCRRGLPFNRFGQHFELIPKTGVMACTKNNAVASETRDTIIEEVAKDVESAPLTYAGPDPQGVRDLRYLIVCAIRDMKGQK